MTPANYPDCFYIINGPEDGTVFPIVRSPFQMGREPACAVNVRLDEAVQPVHARVTVVSEGYRIRRTNTAPVTVNGKRAGAWRSRMIRPGDIVQVGHTQLTLQCAPQGLANRSHGIVTESDVAWAARRAGQGLLKLGKWLLKLPLRLGGRILGHWISVLALLGVLYWLWPGFRYFVQSIYHWFR